MHTLYKSLTSVGEIPSTVVVRAVQYIPTARSNELQIDHQLDGDRHVVKVCHTSGTIVSTMINRPDRVWTGCTCNSIQELPRVSECELKDKTRTKFTFTRDAIYEFVNLVNDQNPIHQCVVPIVPGCMVLEHMAKHVLDDMLLLQLEITFNAPFYGGDVISVEKFMIHTDGDVQKGTCHLVGAHGGKARCKWTYAEGD